MSKQEKMTPTNLTAPNGDGAPANGAPANGAASLAIVEERFLRLAESLDAHVFILELDSMKPIFFNRDEFLGYSREELLASAAIFRAVHPDDAAAVREFSRRPASLPPGETAALEYQLKNKAGEWEWVRHRASGLSYNEDGRPTQLLVLLNVLTAQRKKEDALRQAQEHFQILTDNLPGVAYLCNNDELYSKLFISENVAELTGYPHKLFQTNELSFTHLYHPDDVPALEAEVEAALEERRSFRLQYRLKHHDGRYCWVEEIGAGIFNDEGELLYLEGFLQNIDQRVEAEKIVNETNRQLTTLLANMPGMTYRCRNEPDWPMEFVSEGSLVLTGYQPDELIANERLTYGDLIHPDDQDRVWQTVQAGLADGNPFRVTYRIIDRDNQEKWVWEQGQGIHNEAGELVALEGFVTDISERVKLEEETGAALERRRRQVNISTQIAQQITTTTDLNELYKDVVTLVKEQFGYYHAQLLRYDPAVDAVVLITGYGETGEQMLAAGHRMPMGTGLVGTAAATGRSMLSANSAENPNWRPNPFLPHTRGELAVPIKFGQTLLGVLDVQSDIPNSLNEEDLVMLEGLCGQIAIAVESARLRQEMNQRLDELSKLQRFMSQEGWQAYQATTTQLASGYLFDRREIAPMTEDAWTSWLGDGRNGGEERPSLYTTSLAVRGAAIGMLGLENDPAHPLSPEDEALLESIALQISEAMETARLLEQTQKRAVELETVARVSAAASTLLEVDKLLDTVVNLAQTRFNLYHVSIFLPEEIDGRMTLRMAAASGDLGAEVVSSQIAIPLDQTQSLIARAARTREPVLVNDISREPDYWPHPLLTETKAEMALPMIVGDRLIGVMDVQSDTANRFTNDDARIQTTLAAQIAIALQNANLYAAQLETAAKLREVDRLKSEFLASMSHELRTPLNSIIGFADVMLEGIDGPLNERMTEDVTFIRDSGRHLRELIGEILDMSKIEAGMMELRYNKVDPKRMAKDVLATSSALLQNREVELRLELDPETEIIYADETRLRQILYNLMSNAIKFTERGHVTLKVRTTADELLVIVEDTGIGIRPEDIPLVFEQFRQVDGSLTRKVGGSGLGMPISKSLVELHGGQMGVDSAPGKGSAFWFVIPKTAPAVEAKSDTGPLRPGTGPLRLGPPRSRKEFDLTG